MSNSVLAQVTRKNSYDYDCVHQESILCEKAVSEGAYWRIPTVKAGVHTGFIYRRSETKPTPDSVRTLRISDRASNQVYYVAIADNASLQIFDNACNACCDTVAPLPTVVLPTIIIEEQGCADASGNFSYFANVPATVPAGNVYKLAGVVNGANLPAAPPEGFATLALLKIWADANWAPNSITLTGGKVTLNAGTTGKTGAISVSVEQIFNSNTPGALVLGEHYTLNATINGIALTPIVGAANAVLSTIATAANANPAYSKYGVWSEVGGLIKLVSTSTQIASATLAVTRSV
jgi:hypothetical protein